MALEEKKWKCEDTVSFEYFKHTSFCTLEDISTKLILIQKRFPNKRLYVGQSINPCGRFRKNYDTAIFPPMLSHISARILKLNEQLITESVAHSVDYERMFVLCRMGDSDAIKAMEKDVIAHLPHIVDDPIKNGNGSPGGEGPDGESTVYFIYVCVSKKNY